MTKRSPLEVKATEALHDLSMSRDPVIALRGRLHKDIMAVLVVWTAILARRIERDRTDVADSMVKHLCLIMADLLKEITNDD